MNKSAPLRVGLMLGPHFVRMAGSFGFMKGYFNDYSQGLMPKPYNLTTVSAGSVVGLVTSPFTQKAFNKAERRFLDLRGNQFFSLNNDLSFWGGAEALGPLLLLFPWEKIKNSLIRNTAKGLGVVALEGVEARLINRLRSSNGVFSNERLRK